MEIVTNTEKVGPFDYGKIVTRAKIDINPYTARVTVAASLPTIIGGVPIRLRSLNVTIDHAGFLLNPTSCGTLSTDTSLVSILGATGSLSTPFQATDCGALPFKPSFRASTSAKHTRRLGASLTVSVREQPHEANIKSVKVMLPKKIVANLQTLNHACLEKIFSTDPGSCSKSSEVGHATVEHAGIAG